MWKRCAYCAMQRKEDRTFVICLACNIPLCLVKEKKLFPKASHLGVHIIYMLYIFDKRCDFLFDFYIFPQPLWVFYIYNFLHIYIVIFSILCFERQKVVKELQFSIGSNKNHPYKSLLLYLICHFNWKIRNERGKTTISTHMDATLPRNCRWTTKC